MQQILLLSFVVQSSTVSVLSARAIRTSQSVGQNLVLNSELRLRNAAVSGKTRDLGKSFCFLEGVGLTNIRSRVT